MDHTQGLLATIIENQTRILQALEDLRSRAKVLEQEAMFQRQFARQVDPGAYELVEHQIKIQTYLAIAKSAGLLRSYVMEEHLQTRQVAEEMAKLGGILEKYLPDESYGIKGLLDGPELVRGVLEVSEQELDLPGALQKLCEKCYVCFGLELNNPQTSQHTAKCKAFAQLTMQRMEEYRQVMETALLQEAAAAAVRARAY